MYRIEIILSSGRTFEPTKRFPSASEASTEVVSKIGIEAIPGRYLMKDMEGKVVFKSPFTKSLILKDAVESFNFYEEVEA